MPTYAKLPESKRRFNAWQPAAKMRPGGFPYTREHDHLKREAAMIELATFAYTPNAKGFVKGAQPSENPLWDMWFEKPPRKPEQASAHKPARAKGNRIVSWKA